MRHLELNGRVEKGEGMASRLGCPTANIAVEQGAVIPALGVYIGETELEGKRFPSLVCINDGRTGLNLKMEVHFLNEKDLDLVGKRLHIILLEKLRDLIPFPGEQEMMRMIADDLAKANQWFTSAQSPRV